MRRVYPGVFGRCDSLGPRKGQGIDAHECAKRTAFRHLSTTQRNRFTNPTHHYRVRFYRAMVQAMIRVTVPEIGFTFMSDAPDTTHTIFAMIGHDQNGLFF